MRRRDVRREGFRGPAADMRLGEAFLDAISIVAAVGFAADVSQCVELCGTTFRAGDRGATNDMLVQSLLLQCGAREARAAGREQFLISLAPSQNWSSLARGSTQLICAVHLNNLPRVLQLIQLRAPLDLVDESYGSSALHWACWHGHERIVKALLDGKYEARGAAVNLRNDDEDGEGGWTPLMVAIDHGRADLVRLLLSRGAKQDLRCRTHTALDLAVAYDYPYIVSLLCAAPGAAAIFAERNSSGRTPLEEAIHEGHAACEAVLRAHGAPA